MKTIDTDMKLMEGYLRLLDNLSPGSKLDLISRLSQSVQLDLSDRKEVFFQSFGAWKGRSSADTLIQELKDSRNFRRKTERF